MINYIINALIALNDRLHPVKYRRVVIHHPDYMEVRNVRLR